MNVTVIGAGSWGTTVASLIAPRHPTILWARSDAVARRVAVEHVNPRYLPGALLAHELGATSDLGEAVSSAELLVVGVPTSGFREVVLAARGSVRAGIPIVSLSKGLEPATCLRMTEVIGEVFPAHPAVVLTGPNIAREIMAGQAAAAVVASAELQVAAQIQEILTCGMFRVYVNHDVVGCEIGGALKNVIAIAAGIGQGLQVGDNTRAAVMTRGLAELTRLGVAMGAEQQTFAGLAGMGDLLVTCMSPYSRNRAVGEQLGRGRLLAEILSEMHMVAEGVRTAELVLDMAARHHVDLPICRAINEVVKGELAPTDAYRGLRPARHEADPG
ncbi:MAG: NAD(P)H-dependent glycerol-3-phosphate dehydrogenase [Acidimicrobiales bacterium]